MGRPVSPLEEAYVAAGFEGACPEPALLDNDELVAVYIELNRLKKEAKARADAVSSACTLLDPLVVESFQELGKQSDRRAGGLVYLQEDRWPVVVVDDLLGALPPNATKEMQAEAVAEAKERALDALASDARTKHLVKLGYNVQTLRSYLINECETDPETLELVMPDHLEGKMRVAGEFKARVRKS